MSQIDIDHAVAKRDRHRMGPVHGAKLLNGDADMLVNGSLGDAKDFAHLPSGFALRHPRQDLGLAGR